MKQAFLIIAHEHMLIVKQLVKLLDSEEVDIYILIDSKSEKPFLRTKKSNLYFCPSIDIRWGDVSQIYAELLLFENAYENGPYMYYHLLSGVDLPIKNIEKICDFFKKNYGKEFVGFTANDNWIERIAKYHLFTRYYKVAGRKGVIINFFRPFAERIVNALFKRRDFITFKKGSNWVSITNDFCEHVINNKKWILKRFKYTFCGDEIFIQTLLWNSNFKENIFCLDDEYKSSMREIDWNRGTPYIWGKHDKDLKTLLLSDKLFARKFNPIYEWIIFELEKHISTHSDVLQL